MADITLTADVGYGDRILPVSGEPERAVPFLAQLDEEHVLVEASGSATWSVTRGANGTARSAHASGTTVTPVSAVVQTDAPEAPPVPNPAASISVDNGVDPPFAAATLQATGATEVSPGVVALPSGIARVDSVWQVEQAADGGSMLVTIAKEDGTVIDDGVEIAFDATEAEIAVALGVAISGDADDFTITGTDALAGQRLLVSVDFSGLTGTPDPDLSEVVIGGLGIEGPNAVPNLRQGLPALQIVRTGGTAPFPPVAVSGFQSDGVVSDTLVSAIFELPADATDLAFPNLGFVPEPIGTSGGGPG